MYQHLLPNQYSNNYYLNERSMSVPHLIYNNYNQLPIQFISPIHSPLYNQYQYHSPLLYSPRFIGEGLHNKANSHLCKNKGCNSVKHSMNDGKKMKLKQINNNSTVIDKTQIEVKGFFADLKKLYPQPFVTFGTDNNEDISIYADRGQMEQVMINLLKNAMEATASTAMPQIR